MFLVYSIHMQCCINVLIKCLINTTPLELEDTLEEKTDSKKDTLEEKTDMKKHLNFLLSTLSNMVGLLDMSQRY